MAGDADKLEGWGDIERHLGADRKTILRRGYPVRRHSTGGVYASKAELRAFEFPEDSHELPQTPGDSHIHAS